MIAERIPVTILTGSTGTTGLSFFDAILHGIEDMRVTAIIPTHLKKKVKAKSAISVVPTTERFARLGQGCGCCTVRSDLMTKIKRIASDRSADHVLVNVPPKGDLQILGKTFTVADSDGSRLADIAQLESVITVVDGQRLLTNIHGNTAMSLMERIGSASLIAVEGASNLTAAQYDEVVSTIKTINPSARIIRDDAKTNLVSLRPTRMNPQAERIQQAWCDI